MSHRQEILADRLNAEPAIFKGCSSSELGMIVGGVDPGLAAIESVAGLVAGCCHHGFWVGRCRCCRDGCGLCDLLSADKTRSARRVLPTADPHSPT